MTTLTELQATLDKAIESAALIIGEYHPKLAQIFRENPMKRVEIARGFSAGFVENPEDDSPNFCYTIIEVALHDREHRRMMAAAEIH